MAVDRVDIATVRFLLDRGADPNVTWTDGDLIVTPLCRAAQRTDKALVSLLVEFGANINSQNEVRHFRKINAFAFCDCDICHRL